MRQMILAIDEGADFDLMPDLLKQAIKEAFVEWDLDTLPETKAFLGKRLILIQTKLSKAELETRMNEVYFYTDENGDEQEINFNLGWEILAVEGEPIDELLLQPYFIDRILLDSDDNITETITSIKGRISSYAGRSWTYS
jgi:hypothetical protein